MHNCERPMTDSDKPVITGNKTALVDRFNRRLNYLRISLTDRCNFNCVYCVPDSQTEKLSHKDILRYEEILHLLDIFTSLGISKVRVTGGEPFVRKGVSSFLSRLGKIESIRDLTLTTNGFLLKDNLEHLKSCGIKRLNISLDALDRELFHQITGRDAFADVWQGITLAEKMGFSPIKLNVVALRDLNENEILKLARLSISHPYHIRFIEYMPVGKNILDIKASLLTPEIKHHVEKLGKLIPVGRETGDGPARRFKFQNAKGEIGFISPMSHHFCADCNRLRLTASGKLRVCLLSDDHTDLKTPLRSGCSDADIADLIIVAVSRKPMNHTLSESCSAKIRSQMSAIGG